MTAPIWQTHVPAPVAYVVLVLAALLGIWLGHRAVVWVNGGRPQ